jgi:fucose permease
VVRFPPPKKSSGVSIKDVSSMSRDSFLLAIAFFLFLVSSLEGVINNWTTTYLVNYLSVPPEKALFALSSYVIGMAVMRIFLGSLFRKTPESIILYISLGVLFAGCILLAAVKSYPVAVAALIMSGVGLAALFPLMLSFVGSRYSKISATAFSFVLVIALVGNMLVNFMMGIIAERFGIRHMTSVALVAVFFMFLIARKILTTNKQPSIKTL